MVETTIVEEKPPFVPWYSEFNQRSRDRFEQRQELWRQQQELQEKKREIYQAD